MRDATICEVMRRKARRANLPVRSLVRRLLSGVSEADRLAALAWQFNEDGVLPGLADVLQALKGHPLLAQIRFFLTGNLRLGGKRPLDVLRQGGTRARVLRAARAFGEHGAA